jgi:tight adherence protein B
MTAAGWSVVAAVTVAVGGGSAAALRAARGLGAGLLRSWQRLAEQDLLELFIFVEPRRLLWFTVALCGVLAGAGLLLGGGAAVVVPCCVLAAVAPGRVVRVLRARRLRRLQAQLPDMLALWAGVLRSGRGLMPALAEVAAHQGDPLAQELRLVLRHCRVGGSLDGAMAGLARRVPDSDLELLATTLRLSQELGGHLAEALQRLSATIRDRLMMEARIAALTAQGRLQGVILALLPLGLLLVLLGMEPALARLLLHEPVGWAAGLGLCVLEVLGYVAIRRVVSIRV